MFLENDKVERVDTQLYAGQGWIVGGKVVESGTNQNADLSSMTARMEFRSAKTGALLASLTETSGINLMDGSDENNYEIRLPSSATLKFRGHGEVVSDIFIFDGDIAYPIFEVHFSIQDNHTEWS